jgi:cytosine deaminase
MDLDAISQLGQQHLKVLQANEAIGRWRGFLDGYSFDGEQADDPFAWLTCTLALAAVATDNYGVGAILVDGAGRVVGQGHNQMFVPHFRSDRHAEMAVLEAWEEGRPQRPWPGGLTLYTSVEPCPMCLVRLSTADVRRVLYVAPDLAGGMAHCLSDLPPAWQERAQAKTFAPARCGPGLADCATQIFSLNLHELNARFKAG